MIRTYVRYLLLATYYVLGVTESLTVERRAASTDTLHSPDQAETRLGRRSSTIDILHRDNSGITPTASRLAQVEGKCHETL